MAATIELRVGRAPACGNTPQAILSKAFTSEPVPTEAEIAQAEGGTSEAAEEQLARARTTGEVTDLPAPSFFRVVRNTPRGARS
jgi:hypothetical protein